MAHRRVGPLTVLSAFTGAGGLDLGLEYAGFETVACIELDKWARETIITNRPHWNLLETGDIVSAAYELKPADVGLAPRELSVLAGGPPCQPFSTAAQWAESSRAGMNDSRSIGLLAFLHLAEKFLPHVILIENVPGFVLGSSSALEILTHELSRINSKHGTAYRIESKILSAEEFGIPQRRRRAIAIARRDGKAFGWPVPTHLARPIRAYDALWNIIPDSLPVPRGQWAELLATIPAGMNYQYHTTRGSGRPIFGHRTRFWSFLLKLSPDQPAWTIPAQAGPATGPFHWDNRPLAPEELARLQSFPVDWLFEGGEGAKRKQIGNATPPLLAEVIGYAIGRSVFGSRRSGIPKLSLKRKRAVPFPPAPSGVPVHFYETIGVQSPHPGVGHGPGATRRQSRLLLNELVAGLHAMCAYGARVNRSASETSQDTRTAALVEGSALSAHLEAEEQSTLSPFDSKDDLGSGRREAAIQAA